MALLSFKKARLAFNVNGLPLIGGVILVTELFIATFGLVHQRVDPAYRDYYLSRQTICYLTPAVAATALPKLRLDSIDIAKLDIDAACYALRSGWYAIEAWGVWSDGKPALIVLPARRGKRMITLTVISVAADNAVQASINSGAVSVAAVPSGRLTKLNLAVPANTTDFLNITLQSAKIVTPSAAGPSSDTRHLGVGLISIDWH